MEKFISRLSKYFSLKQNKNHLSTKNENRHIPTSKHPYTERVQLCWAEFAKIEAELQTLLDKNHAGDELLNKLTPVLTILGESVFYEIGKPDMYRVVLALDGSYHRVHVYDYFIQNMPESIAQNWRFIIGKIDRGDCSLRMHDRSISAEDITVLINKLEKRVELTLYCDKLKDLLIENKEQAEQIQIIMLESVLGEVCCAKILHKTIITETPIKGVQLSTLVQELKDIDIDVSNDPSRLLNEYTGYERKEYDLRTQRSRDDVYVGSSCFYDVIFDYYQGYEDIVNDLENFGIVAGYFMYKNNAHEGKCEKLLDFRYSLEDEIFESSNGIGKITGGAVGTEFCYIDFIAFDIQRFLSSSIDLFKKQGLDFVAYGTLRVGTKTVRII